MSKVLYFLATLAESGLSVFGIRTPYEQPSYKVVRDLGSAVEIRSYGPRVAVETAVTDGNQGQAFGRLFRYITGANTAGRTIDMTAPVQTGPLQTGPLKTGPLKTGPVAENSVRPGAGGSDGQTIAMTVPVEMGAASMRFFLPKAVAANPPSPTDPLVRIVTLPAEDFGVIRFSGTLTQHAKDKQDAALRRVLLQAKIPPVGPASTLSYDPPFAVPFLRRNEIAVPVAGG